MHSTNACVTCCEIRSRMPRVRTGKALETSSSQKRLRLIKQVRSTRLLEKPAALKSADKRHCCLQDSIDTWTKICFRDLTTCMSSTRVKDVLRLVHSAMSAGHCLSRHLTGHWTPSISLRSPHTSIHTTIAVVLSLCLVLEDLEKWAKHRVAAIKPSAHQSWIASYLQLSKDLCRLDAHPCDVTTLHSAS